MKNISTDLLVESIFSNINTFNQNYGYGLSPNNQQFGFDFATSAVNIATRQLEKTSIEVKEMVQSENEFLNSDANPLLKESIGPTLDRQMNHIKKFVLLEIAKSSKEFIQLIQGLNSSEFAFGIDLFKKSIENKFPIFTVEQKDNKVLDNSVREVILNAFKEGLGSKDTLEIITSHVETTEVENPKPKMR